MNTELFTNFICKRPSLIVPVQTVFKVCQQGLQEGKVEHEVRRRRPEVPRTQHAARGQHAPRHQHARKEYKSEHLPLEDLKKLLSKYTNEKCFQKYVVILVVKHYSEKYLKYIESFATEKSKILIS